MENKISNYISVSFSIKEMLGNVLSVSKDTTREELLEKVLHKPIIQNGKKIGIINDIDDEFIYGIIYKGYEFELFEDKTMSVELVDYN